MSKPNHQCPNCGHAFDLEHHIIGGHHPGDIAYLQTPNTFSGYPDINQPRVRCPKCRQWMMDKDYEPPKQN